MITALAKSARLSNLPTVWTNVLVGLAAAGGTGGIPAGAAAVGLAVASLIYTGGMLLNDAVDAGWDAAHAPGRPVPSGQISVRVVGWAAALCLSSALCLVAVWAGLGSAPTVVALMLVGCVVLYDVFHKRTAWCALLMGACRGLVYPLGASLAWLAAADAGASDVGSAPIRTGSDAVFGVTVWPALAVLAYVALLTLAARRENIAGARVGGLWAWLLPLPYLVLASSYRPDRLLWTIFVAAAFFAWCTRSARLAGSGRVPGAVSGWLAGICLADALLLMLLNRPDLAPLAVAAWLATVCAQRWIPGT